MVQTASAAVCPAVEHVAILRPRGLVANHLDLSVLPFVAKAAVKNFMLLERPRKMEGEMKLWYAWILFMDRETRFSMLLQSHCELLVPNRSALFAFVQQSQHTA